MRVMNILPPIDIGGAIKTSDAWIMRDYTHVSIAVMTGVVTNAAQIIVEECSAADGSDNVAIAFAYRETPTASDILGAKQAATTAGITTTAVNAILFLIEIDAAQLSSDKPWLRVLTDDAAACLIQMSAILSGAQHQGIVMPSAIV